MERITSINVGYLSTAYHTSFILLGTDWANEVGVRLNWDLFASGPDIVKAFSRGEIDIGFMGLPPAIIGIDRGVPLRCVAGGHMEGTVLIAREGFKPLRDLGGDLGAVLQQFKGRAIGSPPKGSIHDVIIRYYLREAGLEKEVGVRNFDWADLIPEALESREIEAAVGTPALAVVASSIYHVAKIILPPARLWPNNPSYGIVARSGFLEMAPESVEKFLVLHERASNFIREHPREAAKIVSRVMGLIDADLVLEIYRLSPKYCAMLSADFIGSTLKFIPVLRQLGYVRRPLGGDEIFYPAIISRVHPEDAHYSHGLNPGV